MRPDWTPVVLTFRPDVLFKLSLRFWRETQNPVSVSGDPAGRPAPVLRAGQVRRGAAPGGAGGHGGQGHQPQEDIGCQVRSFTRGRREGQKSVAE